MNDWKSLQRNEQKRNFLGAVRRNRLTTTATKLEIENSIKHWLKFAPERDGGRKRREEANKRHGQCSTTSQTALSV